MGFFLSFTDYLNCCKISSISSSSGMDGKNVDNACKYNYGNYGPGLVVLLQCLLVLVVPGIQQPTTRTKEPKLKLERSPHT